MGPLTKTGVRRDNRKYETGLESAHEVLKHLSSKSSHSAASAPLECAERVQASFASKDERDVRMEIARVQRLIGPARCRHEAAQHKLNNTCMAAEDDHAASIRDEEEASHMISFKRKVSRLTSFFGA